MFITKKHIDRRTLLKGAGVALGLPLLESMFPAATALAQAAAAPPRRFFAGFVPALFDAKRRALPDWLAGTVVVDVERGLPPG